MTEYINMRFVCADVHKLSMHLSFFSLVYMTAYGKKEHLIMTNYYQMRNNILII